MMLLHHTRVLLRILCSLTSCKLLAAIQIFDRDGNDNIVQLWVLWLHELPLLLFFFTRARQLMPRKHRSLKAYCALCCYWFLLIFVLNAFWKWHYQQKHRIFKIIFRCQCISGRNWTCSLTVVWNIDLPLDSIVSASLLYILFIWYCMVWYTISKHYHHCFSLPA
jgi:hypothetical protein